MPTRLFSSFLRFSLPCDTKRLTLLLVPFRKMIWFCSCIYFFSFCCNIFLGQGVHKVYSSIDFYFFIGHNGLCNDFNDTSFHITININNWCYSNLTSFVLLLRMAYQARAISAACRITISGLILAGNKTWPLMAENSNR